MCGRAGGCAPNSTAGLRLIWAVRPTETVSQRELSGSAKKVGASSRLERFAVRARALVCTGQLADVSGSRCPSGNPSRSGGATKHSRHGLPRVLDPRFYPHNTLAF
ncbi:hypothetical protein D4764_0116130 [Takifugu flavidus]|uniref:Uncharacterized protein n=1 Tax=Takifugu flavidus TaxID=433684 RepID=A0A5C6MN61_9TELE|nr:hypothetical protein D4764_0116130 [Takifugu flavidus]